MDAKEVAVFDFDGTLVSKDTGYEFNKWLTKQSILRTGLTLTLLPLIGALYYFSVTRRLGINIWCFISTAFQKASLFSLRKNFIEYYFSAAGAVVYTEGLKELHQHQNNGASIIILSGCPRWLLYGVTRHIGVNGCKIIGSELKVEKYALLLKDHCHLKNKLKMARAAGEATNSWVVGYSDSTSDIPMLHACRRKVLVNVPPNKLFKFKQVLPEPIEVRAWA